MQKFLTAWRLCGGLVIGSLVLALVFLKITPADSATPRPTQTIELNVSPLKRQNLSSTVKYIGYVTPIHQVALVPNVSGYVSKVWVEGGEDVKIGEKLLQIDNREYKAAYDAAVATSKQAAANYSNAKVYFDRVKKAGIKAISKTEYDNAQAKYLSAEAEVAAAKAEVAKAKVMLDYTLLQASINGIVGHVPVTTGTYVAPNSGTLLSIVQYDPIRVVFSISDKEYLNFADNKEQLLANQRIKIRLANGELYPQDGAFRFADNRMDNSTNSIAVYADFKNPNRELVANAYVDVLLEKEYKDAFLISQNFVELTNDGIYTYVVKNNQLVRTKLKVLASSGNNYIVGNQFNKDTYLVTDKVPNISKETKVKIKIQEEKK